MSDLKIKPSEITPESTFINRRFFMRAGLVAGSALASGGIYRVFNQSSPTDSTLELNDASTALTTQPVPTVVASDNHFSSPLQPQDKPNTFQEITHYNNFYEFSTRKEAVAAKAAHFVTSPWLLEVNGLVAKPQTFDLSDLLKLEHEERVYRFRCVEGWSMVIPWQGFALKRLLDLVQPLGSARFVAFETYFDEQQMPDADRAGIQLPYIEGLRLDEAMHPLTLLATGLYGKPMPNQNGAPIRLVVPWKYGFKSIKSLVRITLTDKQPQTTWNIASPNEYGFYSNVNPQVEHPRWSQADEQRIGEFSRRPTLMFNGYAEQVAHLYQGMDLSKYF